MAEQTKQQSMRPRRSRAEWEETIEQWRRSGLAQVRFCQQQDLGLSTFQWWRRRLKRETAKAAAGGFVAVRVAGSRPEGHAHLELDLPGGAWLRLPVGRERQGLVAVLQALEEVGRC